MEKIRCIIVLGAQVGLNEQGEMDLAPHTKMRADAAGIAYIRDDTSELIISGGFNTGVRYDRKLSVPVFGTANSDRKPDFSPEAKKGARTFRSEASVIGEYVRTKYEVSPYSLIYEEDSSTTQENAQRCANLTKEFGFGICEVGILTQLFHMQRSLADFRKEFDENVDVIPVFAEDLLAGFDHEWVEKICKYYSTPKGGVQWDVAKIRTLLTEGKSLAEMLS